MGVNLIPLGGLQSRNPEFKYGRCKGLQIIRARGLLALGQVE